MFNRAAKILLVASALAPIMLVYAWVAFRESNYTCALGLIAACAVLIISCLLLLRIAPTLLEKFPFKPHSVEASDRENIAFMLLYLSPLLTSQLGQINFPLLVPTLLIFVLLTATGYSYHFNPLLGLAGWHFYKVSSEEGVTYVLLTKKQLRNTTQISNAGQLTEYILIDLGDVRAN